MLDIISSRIRSARAKVFTSKGHSLVSGVATRCDQAATRYSQMQLCSGSWACLGFDDALHHQFSGVVPDPVLGRSSPPVGSRPTRTARGPLEAPLTAQLRLSEAEADATCEHQRNRAGEAVLAGLNLGAVEHLLRDSMPDTIYGDKMNPVLDASRF